jgi:hypothetical protein
MIDSFLVTSELGFFLHCCSATFNTRLLYQEWWLMAYNIIRKVSLKEWWLKLPHRHVCISSERKEERGQGIKHNL